MRWIALLLAAGLAQAEPTVPNAAWSQAWLDQAYLPRHAALTQSADALASASKAFCETPTPVQLDNVKQHWLITSQAWRAMDGAPAGPMVLERLGRKIDFRPTRPDDIEAAIQGSEINNAATRGLPAMEYLLWGNAQPKLQLAKLKQPERCAYLSKIAAQIASDAHVLDQPWSVYRSELAAENAFFRENLLSEHINLLLSSMSSLQKRMPTAEGVKPEQFIEWRSGSSQAQWLAQWDGMNLALQAVLQRLRDDGASPIANKVQQDIAQVNKNCRNLPTHLAQSSASARLACSKSVATLKAIIEDQIGEQFDLTLGFTEGDGD